FVIILNNGGYGALKGMADKMRAERVAGIEIDHVDFVAIAEAQGVRAGRCEKGAQLASKLREFLAMKGPRLLEVVIQPEAAPAQGVVAAQTTKKPEEHRMNMISPGSIVANSPERFYIGGVWAEPLTGKRLDVISPVTEELVISYPEAGPDDID